MKSVSIFFMVILSLFASSVDAPAFYWICEYSTMQHNFTTESHVYKLVGKCYPGDGKPPIPITINDVYSVSGKSFAEIQTLGDGSEALILGRCENDPVLHPGAPPCTDIAANCRAGFDMCTFRYWDISESTRQAWIA